MRTTAEVARAFGSFGLRAREDTEYGRRAFHVARQSLVGRIGGGPPCPCCKGEQRGTRRVGYSEDPSVNSATSALVRQCPRTGRTFYWRVMAGAFVPCEAETALAIDETRRTFGGIV